MQRNTRMARMSGRTSDQDQMRDELNQVVLRSMLESGMQKSFTASSIDPDWTKETLETVMSLYDQEFRAWMSKEGRAALEADFVATTNVSNSREHECQILEAHLNAKLAALGAVQGTPNPQMELYQKEAQALVEKNTQVEITAKAPPPIEQKTPDKTAPSLARPAQHVSMQAPDNLTIRMLSEIHDAAQKSKAKNKSGYTSDIASVYWRMVASRH